jgi:hypothetical protein
MKTDSARAFERLLIALERELVTASDDEVLEAARDLGMEPALRGSSAFFGVTMSAWPASAADFPGCPDAPPPWPQKKGNLPPAE